MSINLMLDRTARSFSVNRAIDSISSVYEFIQYGLMHSRRVEICVDWRSESCRRGEVPNHAVPFDHGQQQELSTSYQIDEITTVIWPACS